MAILVKKSLNWIKARKYWPPVGRIGNIYGDSNLFFCECPSIDSYED